MRFELNVALRYLASSRAQSALLIGGVALAVTVFTFNAALINGLRSFQIERTIGNVAHVLIEPRERIPAELPSGSGQADRLFATQRATEQRAQIRQWRDVESLVTGTPGVRGVSLNIVGNALASRGSLVLPLTLKGVEPARLSDISKIEENVIAGDARLGLNDVLVGRRLAADLDAKVGQPLFVESDQQRERSLTVRGIYATGVDSLDGRVAYINLATARTLFDLPDGVTEIELELENLDAAPAMARRLGDATGLKVTSWTDKNQRLKEALEGQRRSGDIIKAFTLLTIVIGVASALLLTTYRRRPEIGIMRSFGISQSFVLWIFLLQGLGIGLAGALLGCLGGFGFATFLTGVERSSGGPLLPVDPAQGQYLLALALATLGSVVASICPARAASRIDPVEAIAQ